MKIGTQSCGFAVLALALVTLAGCGGSSSNTASGGGGSTGGPIVSTNNQWTWIAGSNTILSAGSYGTLGTAAATNAPPARYGESSWTDASGNFWIFGGIPDASKTPPSYFNDLWKYSPSTNQWTWVSGSSSTNQAGNYGTLNTAASTNLPGGRYNAASWKDSAGNFWLLGGIGLDKTGTGGNGSVYMNDLWKYSVSANQWTWMGGLNTGANNAIAPAPAIYGTKGTAAAANFPGVRVNAVTWTDTSGSFWLFGGAGADSAGQFGNLSDLWKYSTSTSQWTWIAGPSVINQAATYGSLGTAAAANTPSARYSSASWVDSSNNLWLFGGNQGVAGTSTSYTPLNDLWKFSPSTGQWTWVSGSSSANAAGTYGTKGTAAAGNTPGARSYATAWTDSSNNLWLFGGSAVQSGTSVGFYNDLWKFSPSTGLWTWVNGPSTTATSGTYGSIGVSAASNIPGPRIEDSAFVDGSGNLWLFGGYGFDAGGTANTLNDLWRYQP